MKRASIWCAALATLLIVAGGANAQTIFSFEDPAFDGFFGLGATVSQSTTGATDGTKSLKYDVVPGFIGARTTPVALPAAIGNPPGIQYLLFDLTIGSDVSAGFSDLGVTFFGHAVNHLPSALFGLQAQFADTESLVKPAGLYKDVRIDLTSAANPITFNNESFNQIFGPGPDQLTVASGFQFFVSGNQTVNLYIDNVRAVVPEPASGVLLSLGALVAGMIAGRRRS